MKTRNKKNDHHNSQQEPNISGDFDCNTVKTGASRKLRKHLNTDQYRINCFQFHSCRTYEATELRAHWLNVPSTTKNQNL